MRYGWLTNGVCIKLYTTSHLLDSAPSFFNSTRTRLLQLRTTSLPNKILSKKKLKHKLRASLSDSIIQSVTNSTNLPPLLELIDSAAHKPRISKREKRRITLPITPKKDTELQTKKKVDNKSQKTERRVKSKEWIMEEMVEKSKTKKKAKGKGDEERVVRNCNEQTRVPETAIVLRPSQKLLDNN